MKFQLFWYYTNDTNSHNNLVSVDVTSASENLPEKTSFELYNKTFDVSVGSHKLYFGGLPLSKTLYVSLREVTNDSGVSYEYVRSSNRSFEVTDDSEKLYKVDLSKLYETEQSL